MSILNDKQIKAYALNNGMIIPFNDKSNRISEKNFPVLSYGVSSFGYDVRLAPKVMVFSNINAQIVDPKKPDDRALKELPLHDDGNGEYVIMPPHSYVLGHTIEVFNIPRDIMVIAVGKSTMARVGVILNVTPIEAGFKGQVVIELANNSSLPCKIYVNEGIGQFLFLRGEPCEVSYGDRDGKYQNQEGIVQGKC